MWSFTNGDVFEGAFLKVWLMEMELTPKEKTGKDTMEHGEME